MTRFSGCTFADFTPKSFLPIRRPPAAGSVAGQGGSGGRLRAVSAPAVSSLTAHRYGVCWRREHFTSWHHHGALAQSLFGLRPGTSSVSISRTTARCFRRRSRGWSISATWLTRRPLTGILRRCQRCCLFYLLPPIAALRRGPPMCSAAAVGRGAAQGTVSLSTTSASTLARQLCAADRHRSAPTLDAHALSEPGSGTSSSWPPACPRRCGRQAAVPAAAPASVPWPRSAIHDGRSRRASPRSFPGFTHRWHRPHLWRADSRCATGAGRRSPPRQILTPSFSARPATGTRP